MPMRNVLPFLLLTLTAIAAGDELRPPVSARFASSAGVDETPDFQRRMTFLQERALRRALKAPVGVFEPQATASLRNEVKRIELAAERLQQETLERLAAAGTLGRACSDPALCASTHLALYADRIGASPAGPIARLLELFRAFQGAA